MISTAVLAGALNFTANKETSTFKDGVNFG
jgi:hypothetical protein